MVEAAWALLRWRNAKEEALYNRAVRIAAGRGRARACVALARKLGRVDVILVEVLPAVVVAHDCLRVTVLRCHPHLLVHETGF